MEIAMYTKTRWFREWMMLVMKKIIENYGPGGELIDPSLHDNTIFQYVNASTIYLELTFAATDFCVPRRESVIVKRPIQKIKRWARSHLLLYSEITFYQTYAHSDDNIPKCYYANWGAYPGAVIVLQRIGEYKYHSYLQKHPREIYVTPLDHLYGKTLAVRELARFHSKGYIMKELQRDIFHTIVSRFQKSWVEKINDFHIFFKLLAARMQYLLPDIDISICKKVENIFFMAPQVFRTMSCPQEPLSTICHGNLKLSNIFLNSSDLNRPVMLVNFEYAMYAPAVIDLATYMFLCCAYFEITYFFNIIEAYHSELYSCLMHAGIQDLEKYSFNVFSAEYQRYAIGGLIIACFNLPAIIGQVQEDALNEMDLEDYINCILKDEKNEMCQALRFIITHLEIVGCLSNYQEII